MSVEPYTPEEKKFIQDARKRLFDMGFEKIGFRRWEADDYGIVLVAFGQVLYYGSVTAENLADLFNNERMEFYEEWIKSAKDD